MLGWKGLISRTTSRNLREKNDALPLSPPRQEHRFPFLELGSLSADEQKRKKIVHPQQWPISINRALSQLEHPKGHKLCSRQKKKKAALMAFVTIFNSIQGTLLLVKGGIPWMEVPLKKEVRKHHFNWGDNTGIYPMTVQFCQDYYRLQSVNEFWIVPSINLILFFFTKTFINQ